MADKNCRVSRPDSSPLPGNIDTGKHSPPLDRHGARPVVNAGFGPSHTVPERGDLTPYRLHEAAAIMRMCATTLRLRFRTGEIPADCRSGIGRKVWMTGDQIRRAIEHCQGRTPPPAPDPVRRRPAKRVVPL